MESINLSATVLTLATVLYEYRPQVVIQSAELLDSSKPMSNQFTLTNISKLGISNITVSCYIDDVEGNQHSGIRAIMVEAGSDPVNKGDLIAGFLNPQGQIIYQCGFDRDFNIEGGIASASVFLVAHFRLLRAPWYNTAYFHFVTKSKADGSLAWFPAPINDLPDVAHATGFRRLPE